MNIKAGQTKTYTVSISKAGGYNTATSLTVNVPAGLSASLAPASTSGGVDSTAQLTVTAAPDATLGNKALTLSGTPSPSSVLSATITVTAGLGNSQPQYFHVGAHPALGALSTNGGNDVLPVQPGSIYENGVVADGDKSAPVFFQVDPLPSGLSNYVARGNVARRSSATSFALSIASGTPAGDYPVTIRDVTNPNNKTTFLVRVAGDGQAHTTRSFSISAPGWNLAPSGSLTLQTSSRGAIPLVLTGTLPDAGVILYFDNMPSGVMVRLLKSVKDADTAVLPYRIWEDGPVMQGNLYMLEVSVDAEVAPGTYTLNLASGNGIGMEAKSALILVVSNTVTSNAYDAFDYFGAIGRLTNKVTTLVPGQAYGVVTGFDPNYDNRRGYFLTKNCPPSLRLYARQLFPNGSVASSFVLIREGTTPNNGSESAGFHTDAGTNYTTQFSLDNANWITVTQPT